MNDKQGLQPRKVVSAGRRERTNSPSRILVVEDDGEFRLLYSFALEARGYEIDFAEDGAAGWEALLAGSYDLLITEYLFPKLTGLELVGKLRAARMMLPVIMAATELPVYELSRNPWLHLTATLTKPFTVDALLAAVRGALNVTDAGFASSAPWENRQRRPATSGPRL